MTEARRVMALRAAAVMIAVLTFVPLANMVYVSPRARWYHAIAVFCLFVGGAVLIALAVLARVLPAFVARSRVWLVRTVLRLPPTTYVGALALLMLAASAVVFVVCFGRQPNDVDQSALLWHGKILLSGRLSLPVDANQEFFAMDDMIMSGRWYSQFPIGASAMTALALVTRLGWLLNPLLAGISVAVVYAFGRRTYGELTGRLAALLLAVSPFVMLMGASYASYVPAMLLATCAIWQLACWTDAATPRARHLSAGFLGAALGAMLVLRPLDAVALTVAVAAMQLLVLRRERYRAASVLTQMLVGAIPVAVLLLVNTRTTGSPFRLGYDVVFGGMSEFGFHVDPLGMMHTPERGLAIVSKYLLELNAFMLGWPVPVFALVVAGLFALRRATRWDWLLLSWFGVHIVLYGVYVFEGWFRGPRYVLTLVPAVALLAARGLVALGRMRSPIVRGVAALVVPACVLLTWTFVGSQWSLAGRSLRQDTTPLNLRVDPARLAREAGLHHALVFVNLDSHNRTLYRLWQVGFDHGNAVRMLPSASSCALNLALDHEGARAHRPAPERVQWIVDEAGRIDALPARPRECAEDVARDASGTASFIPFFPANGIDADGHVAGDVIYAIDLGAHDEVLRARFGDRTWYRFGPRPPGMPLSTALSPYVASPAVRR